MHPVFWGVIGSVVGGVLVFIITKFLSSGEGSLKSFGDLMSEKFNGFGIQLNQINKSVEEIKTDKKESKKDVDKLIIDVNSINSKMHQLSQAIADVDTSAQREIKHNRDMFELYKGTIDSYKIIIETLLRDKK